MKVKPEPIRAKRSSLPEFAILEQVGHDRDHFAIILPPFSLFAYLSQLPHEPPTPIIGFAMRLQFRPDFLCRKTAHLAMVSWNVHRDNRSAANAFRDLDIMGGIFRRNIPAARKIRMARWAGVAALLCAGWAYLHFTRPMADGRASAPEVPLLSIPVSQAVPSSVPEAPALKPPAPKPPAPGPRLASLAIPAAVAKAEEFPVTAGFPEKGYCLIACKRDRTLYVYKRDGKRWDRTAAFPMAIGRNAGDKGATGDLRTPEGRFWITGMVSGEDKGKMYGPLIFTLNYPRPEDAAEGKTGKGIWIHGVEAGKLPTWTHGCLSLANEDVTALAAYSGVGTPVVILPDSLTPDPAHQADVAGMEREYPSITAAHQVAPGGDSAARAQVLKRAAEYVVSEAKAFPELGLQALSPEAKQAILARLEKWRTDWMKRSLDDYASNYDPTFKDRMGRDRQAFMERKRRIFGSKTKIEMEIREPSIEAEGYAQARITFRQDYLADGPQGPERSSEMKSLRMEDGPGGWLIITE